MVKLTIEATDNHERDPWKTGGYAIDDLKFEGCAYTLPLPPGGSCLPSEGMCDTGHCYPFSEKCDFTANCCDGTDESYTNCGGSEATLLQYD